MAALVKRHAGRSRGLMMHLCSLQKRCTASMQANSRNASDKSKDTAQEYADPQKSKDSQTEEKKTVLQLDEELRQRMAGLSGDGGEAGIEYEDAKEQSHDPMTSLSIKNVSLHGKAHDQTYDIHINGDRIAGIVEHTSKETIQGHELLDGAGALIAPSLCHPHIHLDKAFLLGHPKYADLKIKKGDFDEAMTLTSIAKARFEQDDLRERGQRVIDESTAAGVTHMRAFVEVDAGVDKKCLDAGIALKRDAESTGKCLVQICAFAQLPLFSSAPNDAKGEKIRSLMEQAAEDEGVDVIGSTPYVEQDREKMETNVDWMIELSIKHNIHLDFHLDYNMDKSTEPLVWYVVRKLKSADWKAHAVNKTIVFGHCTRFTLFDNDEWHALAKEIKDAQLPIHFVGLPTSDLFMMRTDQWPEKRGTLNIPHIIRKYDINACIGINNIGNAFTPQGSCDPLCLAGQCVGVYQTGTEQDAELLYQCVSTRAKEAIGFGNGSLDLERQADDAADLLLFGSEKRSWTTRRSVSDAVYLYDHCRGRHTLLKGRMVNAQDVAQPMAEK